jgi:bifunctional UDP-N-acetylglucosamine pyrophosphorylase/glucosamine-1-phosphate N-acetyltransferase
MMQELKAASIIFAAGYGSRMKGYSGNKTLLPLLPGSSPFAGERALVTEIINNLPRGPKAVVIHYRKDEVIEAMRGLGIDCCEQPIPNGTGGALIAAKNFLERIDETRVIITMGDVPLVKRTSYQNLVARVSHHDLVVLGFKPKDRAQYGMLEIENGTVERITEWRYWREYPSERQNRYDVFNSGIYAADRGALLKYLEQLQQRPHRIMKERDGHMVEIEEYFITDLVELARDDGCSVGFALAEEACEVMGVDTVEDLVFAQQLFAERNREGKRRATS